MLLELSICSSNSDRVLTFDILTFVFFILFYSCSNKYLSAAAILIAAGVRELIPSSKYDAKNMYEFPSKI